MKIYEEGESQQDRDQGMYVCEKVPIICLGRSILDLSLSNRVEMMTNCHVPPRSEKKYLKSVVHGQRNGLAVRVVLCTDSIQNQIESGEHETE